MERSTKIPLVPVLLEASYLNEYASSTAYAEYLDYFNLAAEGKPNILVFALEPPETMDQEAPLPCLDERVVVGQDGPAARRPAGSWKTTDTRSGFLRRWPSWSIYQTEVEITWLVPGLPWTIFDITRKFPASPDYDGKSLAAKGVVVGSLNYRLGILGFLAHPTWTRSRRTVSRAITGRWTRSLHCNGYPAISLPLGATRNALPSSVSRLEEDPFNFCQFRPWLKASFSAPFARTA